MHGCGSTVLFSIVATTPLVFIAIFSIGFWIGPVQPVTIESAAEVVFPMSESLATAVMQVSGNFLSVALLPVVGYFSASDYLGWVLTAIVGSVLLISVRFEGRYERLVIEQGWPASSGTCRGVAPLLRTAEATSTVSKFELTSVTDTGASSDVEAEIVLGGS